MSRVVRKDGSADVIVGDAKKTSQNADARGGIWKTLADQRLGPLLVVLVDTETKIATADGAKGPAEAALVVSVDIASNLIGKVSDDLWNALGRPGADPYLSLLFPGGIGWYTSGDPTAMPARMGLLISLLRSLNHPLLDSAITTDAADTLDAMKKTLQLKVDPVVQLRMELDMWGHVRLTLARAAQMELAALKRLYKGHGMREAEIHEVIPARPRPEKKTEAKEPTGGTPK